MKKWRKQTTSSRLVIRCSCKEAKRTVPFEDRRPQSIIITPTPRIEPKNNADDEETNRAQISRLAGKTWTGTLEKIDCSKDSAKSSRDQQRPNVHQPRYRHPDPLLTVKSNNLCVVSLKFPSKVFCLNSGKRLLNNHAREFVAV